MNRLDRLEALAQRLIEGTFNRLFQTQLDPVDLVHHLTAAVENGRRNGKGRADTEEALSLNAQYMAKRWVLQLDGHRFRLGEPVINIGRALDNDIVLSDPTVSRYHVQLRWREGRYHLCPPASKNGLSGQQVNSAQKTGSSIPWTTVNQQSATRHSLVSGDVIALGNISLTIIII